MTQAVPGEGAAPARRLPLYLQGNQQTLVDTDGPALRARRVQKTPLRYPLARLARIIAGPHVEWRGDALAACQREGLPIVFLDAGGQPTGYLQPAQAKPSRLHHVLEELLDRADWESHHANWLRAQRMALLQDWRKQRQPDEQDYRELCRRHVYQAEAETPVFAPDTPQAAALTAYTLQTLHHAGLQPRYWSEHGQPCELARDLTRLLGLALRLELHGLGDAMHGASEVHLRILHGFAARIEPLLRHSLGSLHRHYKTLLEEWR